MSRLLFRGALSAAACLVASSSAPAHGTIEWATAVPRTIEIAVLTADYDAVSRASRTVQPQLAETAGTAGNVGSMPDLEMVHGIGGEHGATPSAMGPRIKAGALIIEAPWIRATPGGAKVAGGYLLVTNTGAEPDRLIGASIPISGHGEVHEMSMKDGVMHMAPVEGGIEIKPGQAVELKPGGYHLMFMGMTGPAKQGETISGSLTFAKAGTVQVTFAVAGLGAQTAPARTH